MCLCNCFSFRPRESRRGFVSASETSVSPILSNRLAVPTKDCLPEARHDSPHGSTLECDPQPGDFPTDEDDSGEPSSGLIAHHLPKHSIPACVNGDLDAFQVPDTPPSIVISPNHGIDVKSLSKTHFLAFYTPKASDTAECNGWTIEVATKQVKTICSVFANVKSERALLSMCAWFHLFCFFDDETEKVPAKEAKLAIKQCISILRTTCGMNLTTRSSLLLARPLHHAGILYTFWLSSRLPSGGKVVNATYLFARHAQRLLGLEAFKRVAAKVIDTFGAYHREVSLRENIDTLSVDEYSMFRLTTIGLSPFWEILRCNLFFEKEMKLSETTFFILESYVAAAVGLQNDLVGLAKDFASGDRMNYVTLRAERGSLSIGQALTAAIELHNWNVREAIEEKRRLERSPPRSWEGNEGFKAYMDCLLSFITTHLEWASDASRYKPV